MRMSDHFTPGEIRHCNGYNFCPAQKAASAHAVKHHDALVEALVDMVRTFDGTVYPDAAQVVQRAARTLLEVRKNDK